MPASSEPLLPTSNQPESLTPAPHGQDGEPQLWRLKMLRPAPSTADEDALGGGFGGASSSLGGGGSGGQQRCFAGAELLSAALQALPITLFNLAQSYAFAQLVCVDSELEPALVAAMHLTGLVTVQARLSCSSAVPHYAVASADVTIALLCHRLVSSVYAALGTHTAAAAATARATSLLAVGLASLSQGAMYYAVGRARAAEIVLFLPYPLLAGLLAVTGAMATLGAVAVSTGISVHDARSLQHALRDGGAQLASAAGLALLQLVIGAKLHTLSAFVLLLPAALTIFYAIAGFAGCTLDGLVSDGWLFEAEAGVPLSVYFAPGAATGRLGPVSWSAMFSDVNGLFASAVTSLAAMLLKVVVLESASGAYLDMNAELRAAGSASALAALVGGVAAHPSPDYVTALRQAGVRTRAVGVATIALTASVLASGLPLMNVLPRPLLGSLLMANGVELTKLWLWDARRWIDRPGFAMLFAMICSALLFGQTAAVLLGALCAVFLSHLRLSRANALKYHLTSRSCHPPASRPHHAQAFLRRHGGAIHLIGLEGFLYGGTVSRLSRYVLRASERHGREMRFVLLDLQATHGIEPSACTLLRRLRRQLKARGVSLLVAAASSQMVAALSPEPAAAGGGAVALSRTASITSQQGCESRASCGGAPATAALDSAVYRTVDEALESCEEQLLLLGSPVKSSHREGPSAFSTGGGGRHSGVSLAPTQLPPSLIDAAAAGGPSSSGEGGKAASVGKGAAEGKGAVSGSGSSGGSDGSGEGGEEEARGTPNRLRPYTLDASGAPSLPFAPSSLPPGLSWDSLSQYGAKVTLQPGELLTSQGNLNREVLVVPPSGAELSVTTDYGSPDGPLTLATMRHGGVFGAEGVLLGLPSVSSAVLSRSSPPRVVISLSAAQLRGLRLSQPQLAQQLLAAAFTQQQDYLWLLARRTSLWTGGGHGGPNLDWGSAQPQLVPSADGAPLPTIPSEVSLPESFGRKEVRSAVLSPWRHAVSPQERTPYSAGSRGAGHIAGLMSQWQAPREQRTELSPASGGGADPARMRRFGGKSSPKRNRPGGASSSQQPLHRSARGETGGTSYTLSRDGHAARDELAKAAARRDSGGVGRRSV